METSSTMTTSAAMGFSAWAAKDASRGTIFQELVQVPALSAAPANLPSLRGGEEDFSRPCRRESVQALGGSAGRERPGHSAAAPTRAQQTTKSVKTIEVLPVPGLPK